MSGNSFGNSFVVTTFGESHGVALGCIIDGCPPGLEISEEDIQKELDKRKPGSSKYTTQRKEDDKVEILSGVFEGKTTGTPTNENTICLVRILLVSSSIDSIELNKVNHEITLNIMNCSNMYKFVPSGPKIVIFRFIIL